MDEYKSEIRDSDIEALEDKVARNSYRKYLKRLILKRIRSFTDREIIFDSPSRRLSARTAEARQRSLGQRPSSTRLSLRAGSSLKAGSTTAA